MDQRLGQNLAPASGAPNRGADLVRIVVLALLVVRHRRKKGALRVAGVA
jgi:hypothetical protein